MREWRDIVEDYLYISKKRINNKWAMFKLQMSILQDIIGNIEAIDEYKELEKRLTEGDEPERGSKADLEAEKEHIRSEIDSKTILNKALREVVDGIVWKYFKYNRAILYMLADKEPIETIRMDKGTINALYEFADVFLNEGAVAIFNDITNFLRVGDITQIKDDGTIEIVEVKAGAKRGRRVTRQRQRMSELVEFFNTGLTNYDGNSMQILDSGVRQKNYLSLLHEAINKARNKGFESLLIGDYLILEVVDFSRIKEADDFIEAFESRHKSVKEEWKKRRDFVVPSFFIEKMEYSKNCAPFSIYPFDLEICTDIMMGRLMVSTRLNFSQVLRIIRKAGWDIVDSLNSRSKKEMESICGKDIKDISFLKIRKGTFTIDVPPSLIARMQYELLAPSAVIAEFEEAYSRGPNKEYECYLTNYTDEQRIWR